MSLNVNNERMIRKDLINKIHQREQKPAYNDIGDDEFKVLSSYFIRKCGYDGKDYEKLLNEIVFNYYKINIPQFESLKHIESIEECDVIEVIFIMIEGMDKLNLVILPKYKMIRIALEKNLNGINFKSLDKKKFRSLFGGNSVTSGRVLKLQRYIKKYFEKNNISKGSVQTINI